MPALASTRLLVYFGESLTLHRLPNVSRKFWCQACVRFVSHVNHDNGPLILASLGFKSDFGKTNKNKENKIERLSVSNEAPKSKVRVVRSDSIKAVKDVGVKKSLEIESALFAAKSFSELGLPSLLLGRLETAGFTVPTDVQSAAVPTILKGHDVVIQSYTGSGKTLAYVLPILSEVGPLKKKSPNGEGQSGKKMEIEAVIVAPSRELGMQIVREFERLLGPAIVVGTPGRIAEISAAGKLHTHGCRFLVLDEVDELLSFNFREDMHRILEHVGRRSRADPRGSRAKLAERQTIMVSATVPYSVIRAARSWGSDPLLVQAKKVMSLESVSPSGPVNLLGPTSSSGSSSNMQTQAASQSLPPALKHYHCVTKLQHKVDTLRRCVHALDAKSVIAFMNHTKQLKDAVFKLQARGMKAAELHGDLGKLARSTTTDSIHYAHRAGRTGRLGRKGTVVTICEEPEVFVVKKLQKQLGVPIPACEFTEGKLHVIEEDKTLGGAR